MAGVYSNRRGQDGQTVKPSADTRQWLCLGSVPGRTCPSSLWLSPRFVIFLVAPFPRPSTLFSVYGTDLSCVKQRHARTGTFLPHSLPHARRASQREHAQCNENKGRHSSQQVPCAVHDVPCASVRRIGAAFFFKIIDLSASLSTHPQAERPPWFCKPPGASGSRKGRRTSVELT